MMKDQDTTYSPALQGRSLLYALHLHGLYIERLPRGNEQPVTAPASETNVGGVRSLYIDKAGLFSGRVINGYTLTCQVKVPLVVERNAIRSLAYEKPFIR